MPRPTDILEWAKSGINRIMPGPSIRNNGVLPGDMFGAQHANYALGVLGDWSEYAAAPKRFLWRAPCALVQYQQQFGTFSAGSSLSGASYQPIIQMSSGVLGRLIAPVQIPIPFEPAADIYELRIRRAICEFESDAAGGAFEIFWTSWDDSNVPAVHEDILSRAPGATVGFERIENMPNLLINGGGGALTIEMTRGSGIVSIRGLMLEFERSLL